MDYGLYLVGVAVLVVLILAVRSFRSAGSAGRTFGVAIEQGRLRTTPYLDASSRNQCTQPFARTIAAFMACFTILNLLAGRRLPGFDANMWWIDLRPLPQPLADMWLTLAAIALLAYAVRPGMASWRWGGTAALLGALCLFAVFNAAHFYRLIALGKLHSSFPVPFSLLPAGAFILLLTTMRTRKVVIRPRVADGVPGRSTCLAGLQVVIALVICIVAVPLAQMFCFGKTDYRRPADVAVVFGARAYPDGRCSDALKDRVTTACGLYHQGLVRKLLFSGGPVDERMHETEAMRRLAVQLKVPASVIHVDRGGVSTDATVRNTDGLLRAMNARRVLAVSHFYHLPRVKMRYQRQGWEVYTVPAKEQYILSAMPWLMAREVAALWVYYLAPLWR